MAGKALLGVAGLAIGLLIGYGVGRVSTGTPVNPLSNQGGKYEDGYQAAMQKVADSGILPPAPESSPALEGTVKTVMQDGRLTIEADLRSLDPLGLRGLPKERVVTITEQTTLIRLEERAPEEFDEAQRAFNEALMDYRPVSGSPSTPPSPPSRFKEIKVSLSEIQSGDRVNVSAAVDILNAASFEAVNVTILPALTPPDVSPPPGGPTGGAPQPGTPPGL